MKRCKCLNIVIAENVNLYDAGMKYSRYSKLVGVYVTIRRKQS